VALEAVQVLQERLKVSRESIEQALQQILWAGRLQWITTERNQRFLLDGAHNAAGARALSRAVAELVPKRPDQLILGMLRDKDCEQMCRILASTADDIYLCPVESERSATPETLAAYCQAANPKARVHCTTSLHEAIEQVRGVTLLTGSLYFVGQAIELLQPAGRAGQGERGLNEWTGVSR
jgi:dihydrofolate synthase/folylpolyglutamate synthase